VASTVAVPRNGAVGFIDWLDDCVASKARPDIASRKSDRHTDFANRTGGVAPLLQSLNR